MRRPILALALAGSLVAACGDPATTPDTTTVSSSGGVPLAVSEGVERAEPLGEAPVAELAAGFNDAGFGLWQVQAPNQNLVFSPMSIGHAMLMARAAADLGTGRAIDAGFGLPDGVSPHEAWNALDQTMAREGGGATLRMADRIWPRTDVTPGQDWIDLLATYHGVTTEALDLAGDPSGSRETINGWVGDQTEGLIPELLPEGFIDSETVLVLTDAIYFEAAWATPFGKYAGTTGDFTRLDGSTVEVDYMRELELEDRRGIGDGYEAAEVPYSDGEFSMLLIIPDEGRFDELRGRLGQGLVGEVDDALTTGPYELLMPKWETTTQMDLLAWLQAMGAAPGDFPEISPGAFLGGAVHGADIAVDEWGTVAAAATGLGFEESATSEPGLTIQADQPFLYLIRHRSSGLALFAGQLTDPDA